MSFLHTAGAAAVFPEIVLAVLAMALLMFGAFREDESSDAVTIAPFWRWPWPPCW